MPLLVLCNRLLVAATQTYISVVHAANTNADLLGLRDQNIYFLLSSPTQKGKG